MQEGIPNKIIFVERFIYTDRFCFAQNCYESGKMTKLEYDVYCRWNDWLAAEFQVQPTAYIYLQCMPNVNNERIIKRAERVNLIYQLNIFKCYTISTKLGWILKRVNFQC